MPASQKTIFRLNISFDFDFKHIPPNVSARAKNVFSQAAKAKTATRIPRIINSLELGCCLLQKWNPDPPTEIETIRHGLDGQSDYTFLDGHVEGLKVEQTFNPAGNLNRWNPKLAR